MPLGPDWLDSAEGSLEGLLKTLAFGRIPEPNKITDDQAQRIKSLLEMLKNPLNLDLPSIGLPRPKPEDTFKYP